ncbi:hypothetical protein AC792_03690 [Arthrobacter sp. RIT-PI-e]|uniref:hypothetical protein n=1 Tax=Arthrobacter sp. RIT-PI-e TaxID=1681197 RepID=UPI00067639D1|nr:hypothetical protein [Arthrobacter sp. RIT-PI-e]KNC19890.1 hypothetical protein AC792_03690 [Arthrobacter sp. RIT-PI-e]
MPESESFQLHAWVDESMRGVTGDQGMYLLGAVVADPAECEPTRDELRAVLPKGARKLHWTDMGEREKKQVTGLVCGLDVAHMVVIGTPLNLKKQEKARAKCMERLLWELGEMGVSRVFLEHRTPSLNSRDMKLVDQLRGRQAMPASLRVDIAQPSTEPMLWIPDQMLGAMGDAETNADGSWLELYNGAVHRIDIEF